MDEPSCLIKLLGFTYARIGGIRQLTFLKWHIFSAIDNTWTITFKRMSDA
jgi:hypothetical protein